MRRITCREAAIEGVITRHGTLVGPLMTELAGFPELTPYGGGWCGNDVHGSLFSDDVREVARARTMQMGERLRKEGYRGYFELDFLADVDTGEMYLGEMNPRVTGASSMTNVTAVAYGDMPLFLFHLLEFMDVDYEIDVDELNERWAHPQNIDAWSQFILKETDEQVEMLTGAPQSGIWRMQTNGAIRFARKDTDWHTIADEDHAFYLRIADAGNYRYPGADLGILVTRGNLMDDDGELTDRAHSWITAIKGEFHGEPATTREMLPRAGALLVQDAVTAIAIQFEAVQEGEPDARWQAHVRRHVARLPAVVPARGRGRPGRLRGVAADAARAHAGAGADLGAPGRAGRRRRRGGAHALDVAAAVLPVRLLAGRAGGGRSDPRAQLRLRAAAGWRA